MGPRKCKLFKTKDFLWLSVRNCDLRLKHDENCYNQWYLITFLIHKTITNTILLMEWRKLSNVHVVALYPWDNWTASIKNRHNVFLFKLKGLFNSIKVNRLDDTLDKKVNIIKICRILKHLWTKKKKIAKIVSSINKYENIKVIYIIKHLQSKSPYSVWIGAKCKPENLLNMGTLYAVHSMGTLAQIFTYFVQ